MDSHGTGRGLDITELPLLAGFACTRAPGMWNAVGHSADSLAHGQRTVRLFSVNGRDLW